MVGTGSAKSRTAVAPATSALVAPTLNAPEILIGETITQSSPVIFLRRLIYQVSTVPELPTTNHPDVFLSAVEINNDQAAFSVIAAARRRTVLFVSIREISARSTAAMAAQEQKGYNAAMSIRENDVR